MTYLVKMIPIVLVLLIGLASPGWSIEVGEPMPDFAIQTFDGRNASRATLQGKPTLLVFWNTWCPNCLRELPQINRLAEEFGPRGLEVLAINTAINDSERKARAYRKKYGYGFPVGFDQYFEIGDAFGIRGVPTVFLVDAQGIVRYKQARLPEDMTELFKQLGSPGDQVSLAPSDGPDKL